MSGMREGINSGRPRANFPRKFKGRHKKKSLSPQISEGKSKRSQRSVKETNKWKWKLKTKLFQVFGDSTSDEGVTVDESALETLYGVQFTLSSLLIKPHLFILPPTKQHHSFLRNLTPFIHSQDYLVTHILLPVCWNHVELHFEQRLNNLFTVFLSFFFFSVFWMIQTTGPWRTTLNGILKM